MIMKKMSGFLFGLLLPFAAVLLAPFLAIHDFVQNISDLM
jgi:hypothetical protein